MLQSLPEAFDSAWRVTDQAESLTVGMDGLWQGITGKEKKLSLSLDKAQSALLLGLAAHAKGLTFTQFVSGVMPLLDGWLEIEILELAQSAQSLAEVLRDCGLSILESAQERYFRLAVAPDCLFFGEEGFYCTLMPIEGGKWTLCLRRESLATPFGITADCEQSAEISAALAVRLQAAQRGEADCLDDANLKKSVRDTIENKLGIEAMGLRKLLRVDGKRYAFACHFDAMPT